MSRVAHPEPSGGELLTIGQASERTHLTPKAIRLYERKGLLPPPRRSDAGYRLYSAGDLAVLAFIRRARALNLHLDEIADILHLQRGGEQPCGRVLAILDSRIAEIDRSITDLMQLRRSLHKVRRAAQAEQHRGQDALICHIIEEGDHQDRRML